jgi:hypothetical protein
VPLGVTRGIFKLGGLETSKNALLVFIPYCGISTLPSHCSTFLQWIDHSILITTREKTATMSSPEPISVLFVCLGNICRSTMAEGVFRSIVSKPPYQSLINVVDSCGTGAYHTGDSPDSRTMSTLGDNGITDYEHAARKVCCIPFT